MGQRAKRKGEWLAIISEEVIQVEENYNKCESVGK